MSTLYRFDVPRATLEAPHTAAFEVNKSHFIAWVARCESPEDAHALLHVAREHYADARHHCSAFIAGPPGEQTAIGFSDDGEPGGTAGRPIYQVLEGSGLGQIGCVVIRYFGGIKLGTGGLVRAYTKAALMALETLPLTPFISREEKQLLTDFSDEHTARRWIERHGGIINTVDYQARGAALQLIWPSDTPMDIDDLNLELKQPAVLLQ